MLYFCRALSPVLVVFVSLFCVFGNAESVEIRVMNSGGFSAAYRALAPEFEQKSGHSLKTAWGPSMGETPDAIPQRLKRGENADLLIMVKAALESLVSEGVISCSPQVDLASSGIAMAVRKGAAIPDIRTVDSFKNTLQNAASIAYSDSASGEYLSKVLFKRIGMEELLRSKSRMIPAEPVGNVVARGEAELGFQQMSELLPVPGIQVVGHLPQAVQKITVFSACVPEKSKNSEAARELVRFLSASGAAVEIRKSGMEPLTRGYGK